MKKKHAIRDIKNLLRLLQMMMLRKHQKTQKKPGVLVNQLMRKVMILSQKVNWKEMVALEDLFFQVDQLLMIIL